jgi:hypothetical protein
VAADMATSMQGVYAAGDLAIAYNVTAKRYPAVTCDWTSDSAAATPDGVPADYERTGRGNRTCRIE